MKLVVEIVNNEDVKVTLTWNGKDYSETWSQHEYMPKTISPSIIHSQLEKEGIIVDNTALGDVLDSVDIDSFLTLAKRDKPVVTGV